MKNGVLNKEELKVIYVAPMKALAQEIVAKFGKSLAPLGLQVREYTGDMQLTKREIVATQLIVTTPEKWDVVTRKGSDALVQAVGLLIIDEVHLLNDDRGPVIEALVARTLRLVESSQSMIRIVGLFATLTLTLTPTLPPTLPPTRTLPRQAGPCFLRALCQYRLVVGWRARARRRIRRDERQP